MSEELRERQRRSFEETAENYDRYRPRYPHELFEQIRAYADLAPDDDRILEVGCGPGIATVEFAQWPNHVTAIDPAPAMTDIARLNLAAFDNVEVITTKFEDWELERGAFGLVACTQSFHWLNESTRYQRIADALYAHGTMALLWNVQIVKPEYDFFDRVQEVYLEHAPEIAHQGEFRTDTDDAPLEEIRRTGLFEDVESKTTPWEWTLDTNDYIGLIGTHSPHAALEAERRARLCEGIATLVDSAYGGYVTEHYIAVANLGRKR